MFLFNQGYGLLEGYTRGQQIRNNQAWTAIASRKAMHQELMLSLTAEVHEFHSGEEEFNRHFLLIGQVEVHVEEFPGRELRMNTARQIENGTQAPLFFGLVEVLQRDQALPDIEPGKDLGRKFWVSQFRGHQHFLEFLRSRWIPWVCLHFFAQRLHEKVLRGIVTSREFVWVSSFFVSSSFFCFWVFGFLLP